MYVYLSRCQLFGWMVGEGETFLRTHTNPGQALHPAADFSELHQRMQKDVEVSRPPAGYAGRDGRIYSTAGRRRRCRRKYVTGGDLVTVNVPLLVVHCNHMRCLRGVSIDF